MRQQMGLAYNVVVVCGLLISKPGAMFKSGSPDIEQKVRRRDKIMSELVTAVSDSNFEKEVLQSGQPVLVDFWATWCGPCRVLAPVLEKVAQKYEGNARVVKVDVDENSSTTQRYGIKGMPTLVLFKDGNEQERIVGAVSGEVISRMIDKHVNVLTEA
jgi:thioredoxin 1